MQYKVEVSDDAKNDIEKLKKAGRKIIVNKIYDLLDELKDHPRIGTGKPEYLKYKKCWSRRIDNAHRLCYEIYDDVVVVLVISAYGHYDEEE